MEKRIKELIKKLEGKTDEKSNLQLAGLSDDGKAIAYPLEMSAPQINAGIEYSQGWNAYNGRKELEVVPVRVYRDGKYAQKDNFGNFYSFVEMIATGKGYDLCLKDGEDFLKIFCIDFENRRITLEKIISRAERKGFRVEGYLSLPGLGAPKDWPTFFTIPFMDSWKETLKEIENQTRRTPGNYSVVKEWRIGENTSALRMDCKTYQSDGKWNSRADLIGNEAIYGLVKKGDIVKGKVIDRDVFQTAKNSEFNHVRPHIKFILDGIENDCVLKYAQLRVTGRKIAPTREFLFPQEEYITLEKEADIVKLVK